MATGAKSHIEYESIATRSTLVHEWGEAIRQYAFSIDTDDLTKGFRTAKQYVFTNIRYARDTGIFIGPLSKISGSLATKPSETSVELEDGKLKFQCDCRDFRKREICQHTGMFTAVMLRVITERGGYPDAPDGVPNLVRRMIYQHNVYNSFYTKSLIHVLRDMLSETSSQLVDMPEPAWWLTFLEASDTDRSRLLAGIAADHIVLDYKPDYYSPLARQLAHRHSQPSAPEGLLAFKAEIERLHASERICALPWSEGFLNFISGDDFARAARRANLATQMNHLEASLREEIGDGTPSRIDLELQVPKGEKLPSLKTSVLLTGKSLSRSPRARRMLSSLLSELRSGRRSLHPSQREVKGDLVRFLQLHEAGASSNFKDDTLFGIPEIEPFLSSMSGCDMLKWADSGEEPILLSQKADLVCERVGDTLAWFVECLVEGESRRVPIAEAVLFTNVLPMYGDYALNVYIRNGAAIQRVRLHGMQPAGVKALRELGELPIDAIREHNVGRALAKWIATHQPKSEGLVQPLPANVRLMIRMTSRQFRFVAQADTGEVGGCFWLNANGMWQRIDSETAQEAAEDAVLEMIGEAPVSRVATDSAPPDAIIYTPAEESVRPLQEWLDRVFDGPRTQALTAEGLTLSVGGNDELRVKVLQLWPERPEEVEYLGSESFRRLVTLMRPPTIKVKVESTGIDWLKVSVDMEAEVERLSLREVIAALEKCEGALVTLPGGRIYNREELEQWRSTVESLHHIGISERGGDQRVHALQAAGGRMEKLLDADSMPTELLELQGKLRSLVREFAGVPEAPVHLDTAKWLRAYQRTGANQVTWSCENFGGAMLCDDMGLGKTLQLIAALTALRHKAGEEAGPTLIVCPQSVTSNWRNELRRFAPELRVAILQSGVGRQELLKSAAEYDVLITNYAIARIDEAILVDIQWFMVCVDEAQAIKNPRASITSTMKNLNARYRVALSGTPLENRLLDLWSITDFAVPGLLGAESQFLAAYSLDGAESVLRARLRPVLMRRRKEEVAPELPPRIEESLYCEMTTEQKRLYAAEVKRARLIMSGDADSALTGQSRIQMLAALTRMRQICCHPSLLGHTAESGKMGELIPLVLQLISEGKKVLLFSQFVKMLELIKKQFKADGIPHHMLTGATRKREEVVKAFEEDPEATVFLISLKAGGTGLNLVSASYVVIFDPWWNPAVEAQAIDRAHRIGQNKTVVALRLVARGTVEERIRELQERKQALVKGVFDEDAFNKSLSTDDIQFLLEEMEEEE